MRSSLFRPGKDTLVLLLVCGTLAVPAFGQESVSNRRVACVNGFADGYPCEAVDLLAFVSNADLNAQARESLDIWGWTDPETGAEYVLAGMDNGTSFVDVSDPQDPRVVGFLPHSGAAPSGWRDVKTYANHAYIVADRSGLHGLQVFDLTQLRGLSGQPVQLTMTAHYQGFGSAHNVAINEDTGFAYVVGASGGQDCGGGLHMVNVQIPDTPRFVGCFSHDGTGRAGTGYTHDVQCVDYQGPDVEHVGKEICLASNETAVSIADVTVKGQARALAKAEYPGVAYAHQGWLTEDQRIFILGDELDERAGEPARSLIFDVSDLDDPIYLGEYQAVTRSIDHNLYVRGDFAYQANYTAGLRILDISEPELPQEIAYFDTTPTQGGTRFAGAWSSYPFFDSGTIAVSSIGEGMFLLSATHPSLSVDREVAADVPDAFGLRAPWPNPFTERFTVEIDVQTPGSLRVTLTDLLGREVHVALDQEVAPGVKRLAIPGTGLASGVYMLRVEANGGVATRAVTRH
ncbi:MAG: choice-of-anchor B family protein [Rhodothermales bacterium]|nr:choice-of-anchor B family protein [Rhodothermales bacterium]